MELERCLPGALELRVSFYHLLRSSISILVCRRKQLVEREQSRPTGNTCDTSPLLLAMSKEKMNI